MITRKELKQFDIKTKKDVKEFVKYVIEELKINFHCDDGFDDIIVYETKELLFDAEASNYLNELNDKCFEIVGDEYYDIALDILEKSM